MNPNGKEALRHRKATVLVPINLWIDVPKGWGDPDETSASVRDFISGYLEQQIETLIEQVSNAPGETGLEIGVTLGTGHLISR